MLPWIVLAVVAVPLLVIAFARVRRTRAADWSSARSDAVSAETESEFALAEQYESEWHEADKERYHQERLP